MTFILKRPLVFFDLETTGTQITKDRIVEICIFRINVSGEEKIKTWRVNPQQAIPESSAAIHGITDDMVKNEPTFNDIAHEIKNWIQDADLAGYNSNRFDVPLLAEEFYRADIEVDWEAKKMIDVQSIFFMKEPRTLTAAYAYYCQKDLKGAHGAEADTRATAEILSAQIERYDDLKNDMDFLAKYTKGHRKNVDFAGMIVQNSNKEACFNFGKYKNQPVIDVLKKDSGYYGWIQKSDFPLHTKKVITRLYLQTRL
ncbi:MAG: exonuclease domain-containing protein [Flavobacteriales bacterium]